VSTVCVCTLICVCVRVCICLASVFAVCFNGFFGKYFLCWLMITFPLHDFLFVCFLCLNPMLCMLTVTGQNENIQVSHGLQIGKD